MPGSIRGRRHHDSGSVVVNLARGMAVAGDGTDSLGYLELVIGSAADDILKGGKRAID